MRGNQKTISLPCPKCGSGNNIVNLYVENGQIVKTSRCIMCGYWEIKTDNHYSIIDFENGLTLKAT